ncbi:MAG: Na/Pi cotransporter family protein [Clostridia bacterium]|nr:Na/Pi cotransporter family protein [Clostridia bacterium]
MSAQDLMMFLVKLIAGTGVFLVGVHLLTENIEQLATHKIKAIFGKTAGNKLANVAIGMGATALIQSSGVTTVLIVGFVNIGIISLSQAAAMIMGANIGTTITAQIAALSTFPITTYVQALAGIGIMTAMICKRDRTRQIGYIMSGLGLIFIGLSVMSDSMKINHDAIQMMFANITSPFLLFFIGIVLTALVQSSSAITSVVIAMSVAGLRIGTGGNEMLYIILGTNIGSCVTALMSALSSGLNAKRTSCIHLLFNVFGSVIFLVLLICVPRFMELTFARWFPAPAMQIAMFHTFFNLTCTVAFLPFSEGLVRLSHKIVREKKTEVDFTYLDERMIITPALAVSSLKQEMILLMDSAMNAFDTAYRAFTGRDKEKARKVAGQIEETTEMSNRMLAYMVKASTNIADEKSEKRIAAIHENIGDIMRIAEIADNFVKYTQRAIEDEITFTDEATTDIEEMTGKVHAVFELTKALIRTDDGALLATIDATEAQIDDYRKKLLDEHVERMNAGLCRPESSSIYFNLVSNLERMGDHITYIAHTVK